MLKIAKRSLIKIPVSFFLAGIFLFNAHAQSKIEKLTSTDKPVVDGTSKEVISPTNSGRLNRHSVVLGFGQTFLMQDLEDTGEDKITFDGFYNYSASYS